ncbi:MAG: FAD-dependent oxidoreductase [Pseudomonadota bacterium]
MSEPYELVLVGGGHAHVAVLADWAQRGCPVERAALLTPSPQLRYSGMVPGWISGEHGIEAGLVNLAGLAKAAGVELVLDRCIALDPATRNVLTLEHGVLRFDHASIDVGGVGRASRVLGNDPRLVDVRPIDRFVEEIAERASGAHRVAVVGGGAGGVELAFGLGNRARGNGPPHITMITGEGGLLPGFSEPVTRSVRAEMDRQSIHVFEVDAWMERGVLMAGEVEVPVDLIVAAIGSGAPDWPVAGGLAVDRDGFIAVDAHQRSTSHPHIFAVGDCARRMDSNVDHAGVHAVHAGPVLAANLRAVSSGKEPRQSYRPRPASLYLLSTGNGSAIASYGPLATKGKWVARLKAWIDTRWIARYAALSNRA